VELSAAQIRWILIDLFVLIISVALHEFGHAFMADKLGDDTPRRQGRVTLNPIAHADPIGTLLLPVLGGIYGAMGGVGGGFGWGRPVQWQPHKVRRSIKMSTASILVAVAGPGMNFLLGTVLALVHVVLLSKGVVTMYSEVDKILAFSSMTNFVLLFFNLVPTPPLDGGHVLANLLPRRLQGRYENVARFGPFIVMAVAMIPPINKVFLIPAEFLDSHIMQMWSLLF
jgi:Zn-dependent protease